MGKHISIDDIVKEGLSEGKEQLNLGAWANMERLLDGKDPYRVVAPLPTEGGIFSKRKIGLALLALIVLVGGVFSGIHFSKNKKNKSLAITAQTETKVLNNTTTTTNNNSNNTVTETPIETENTPSNSTVDNSAKSTSINNNSIEQNTKSENSPRTENVNNLSTNHYNTVSTYTNKSLNKKHKKQTFTKTNAGVEVQSNEQTTSNNSSHQPLENNKESSLLAAHQTTNNKANNTEATITKEKKYTKYETISLKAKKSKDANAETITFDTVAKFNTLVEKEETLVTAIKKEIPENPRLVKLSTEETQKADAKPSVSILNNKGVNTSAKSEQVVPLTTKNNTTKKEKGKNFISSVTDKVNTLGYSIKHFQNPFYFGFSTGVNADLFSKAHNFGGFHAGFTALKPITNSMSFLGELKYYIRNNSGYTIKDYSLVEKSQSAPDYNSVPGSVVYSATYDSVSSLYNFKSFSAIELPLIIQYHFRSIDLYGGINASYGFKIPTSPSISRTQKMQQDTLSLSVLPSYRFPHSNLYTANDFKQRLGLGYTIGAAYNFSKTIYVDLRLSRTLTDNMKTNSAKEISNTFFKVPYLQLSIGYKFGKGYRPNR